MIIPDENLDAMVEFLISISETSGDHFMQAAAMLQAQRTYITKLEAQAAIGGEGIITHMEGAQGADRNGGCSDAF